MACVRANAFVCMCVNHEVAGQLPEYPDLFIECVTGCEYVPASMCVMRSNIIVAFMILFLRMKGSVAEVHSGNGEDINMRRITNRANACAEKCRKRNSENTWKV